MSKLRRSSSSVSQVKDFYEMLVFSEFVVDQNRSMGEFPHPGARANAAAHPRECLQQFYVVEQ